MNTRFKYGFAWFNLVAAFLACAVLGLGSLWLALSNKSSVQFAGAQFSSAGFSIIMYFVGGSFAFCAWILVTIMRRQVGMQTSVWMDSDSLHLPVMKTGIVTIHLKEITELQIILKSGQKILRIKTSQEQYELEGRMMEKSEYFDILTAAIKEYAPEAVFSDIESKKITPDENEPSQ